MSDGKPFYFNVYPLHLFYLRIDHLKASILQRIGVVGSEMMCDNLKLLNKFGIYVFSFGEGANLSYSRIGSYLEAMKTFHFFIFKIDLFKATSLIVAFTK